MGFLAVWCFFGIIAAMIAAGKGRSAFAWFFLGLLFGPFSLAVAALPSLKVPASFIPASELRPCPECAEKIRKTARKCRFCGSPVVPLFIAPEWPEKRCPHCAQMNKAGRLHQMQEPFYLVI